VRTYRDRLRDLLPWRSLRSPAALVSCTVLSRDNLKLILLLRSVVSMYLSVLYSRFPSETKVDINFHFIYYRNHFSLSLHSPPTEGNDKDIVFGVII